MHKLTPLEEKLNQKLQQSQHLFNQLAHAIQDIIYVFDLEKSILTFINDAANVYLGSYLLFQHIHPGDEAAYRQHLGSCSSLTDEETKQICLRMKVKDGSWKHFLVRDKAFMRNRYGRVCRITGVARCLYQEKIQEGDPDENKRLAEQVMYLSPDIIFITSLSSGKTEFVNPAAAQWMGFSLPLLQEKEEQWLEKIMHPEDYEKRPGQLKHLALLEDNEYRETEIRLQLHHTRYHEFRLREKVCRRNAEGEATHIVSVARYLGGQADMPPENGEAIRQAAAILPGNMPPETRVAELR